MEVGRNIIENRDKRITSSSRLASVDLTNQASGKQLTRANTIKTSKTVKRATSSSTLVPESSSAKAGRNRPDTSMPAKRATSSSKLMSSRSSNQTSVKEPTRTSALNASKPVKRVTSSSSLLPISSAVAESKFTEDSAMKTTKPVKRVTTSSITIAKCSSADAEKKPTKDSKPTRRGAISAQFTSNISSNLSSGKELSTASVLRTTNIDKENKMISLQRTVQSKSEQKDTSVPRKVTKQPTLSKSKKVTGTTSGSTVSLKNHDAKKKLTDMTNDIINKTNHCGSRVTRQTRAKEISLTEITNSQSVKKESKAEKEGNKLSDQFSSSPKLYVNQCILDGNMKGAELHRRKLKKETDRLSNEADTWSCRQEEDLPEHIKDEILAVVGQTRLLLSQKFRDFENLINRCECGTMNDGVKVTLEDLEGFWDMMYQQVIQLDKKYSNLQELENNQWQEKLPIIAPVVPKKVVVQKKKPQIQASSKFREFLKLKQQAVNTNIEISKTPDKFLAKCGNINVDDLCFHRSTKKGDEELCEIPDVLKTPKNLPGIERVLISDRKSRRSSAGIIILRQSILMKSLSSKKGMID